MNRTLKLQRIIYLTIVLQLLIALFAIRAWSQTPSLDNDFIQLMEKSETYDKYKVISKTKLDDLWGNVQTEMGARDVTISELEQKVMKAQITEDSLTARVNGLSRQLTESQSRNGSIPFMGIEISHATYHSLVWSAIGILVIGLIYFGFRFKASGRVVDQLLLEKEAISAEFEDHKFNAHQKMLKTKRELQTALNKLQELQVH